MANGKVIYDGPSLIDGKPIVAIAVLSTANRKTGVLWATYILRSDIPPVEAARLGEDSSVCGSCVHRGDGGATRSCYVLLFQGVTSVYDAYKRGAYKVADPLKLDKTLMVRLGAYGDPAVVPREVWDRLLKGGPGHVGYTHNLKSQPEIAGLVQVSADSEEEAQAAWAEGHRTFRVMEKGARLLPGEIRCPASEEMGKRVTCTQCKLCNGRKANVAIEVHGAVHLRRRFKLNLEHASM